MSGLVGWGKCKTWMAKLRGNAEMVMVMVMVMVLVLVFLQPRARLR
jgi:hypothetical protein